MVFTLAIASDVRCCARPRHRHPHVRHWGADIASSIPRLANKWAEHSFNQTLTNTADCSTVPW